MLNKPDKVQVEKEETWQRCKDCREEWTPKAINDYGSCPVCHRKFMGKTTDGERIAEIIHPYLIAHREWTGALDDLPEDVKRQIKPLFAKKINDDSYSSLKNDIS